MMISYIVRPPSVNNKRTHEKLQYSKQKMKQKAMYVVEQKDINLSIIVEASNNMLSYDSIFFYL